MYADDYDGVLADMRRVVAAKKSESEPLRLIYAICDSGLPAVHAFLDTKFQKYLLRQIKYIDSKALASTDAAVDGYDSPVEEAELGETSLSSTNFKPTKINPLFLMMYGHLMACGKAYQSAIGAFSAGSLFQQVSHRWAWGASIVLNHTRPALSVLPSSLRSLPR